jgi:hypothetical protein
VTNIIEVHFVAVDLRSTFYAMAILCSVFKVRCVRRSVSATSNNVSYLQLLSNKKFIPISTFVKLVVFRVTLESFLLFAFSSLSIPRQR